MNASSRKQLKFSPRAAREYLSSLEHIAAESIVNAALVQGRIETALDLLRDYPLIGKKGRVPGTREYPVANTAHTLVYRVTSSTVYIGHVLHQARDYP